MDGDTGHLAEAAGDAAGSRASSSKALPNRPRVSFASVETRTFKRGWDDHDHQVLSTPTEKLLSPLDASALSEEHSRRLSVPYSEDSCECKFPGLRELCRTPDDSMTGSRRESLLSNLSAGERGTYAGDKLGDMQRRIRHSFAPSPGALTPGSEADPASGRDSFGGGSTSGAAQGRESTGSHTDLETIPDVSMQGEETAELDGLLSLAAFDEQDVAERAAYARHAPEERPLPSRLSSAGSDRSLGSPGGQSDRSDFAPTEWDLFATFKKEAAAGSADAAGEFEADYEASAAPGFAADAAAFAATLGPPPPMPAPVHGGATFELYGGAASDPRSPGLPAAFLPKSPSASPAPPQQTVPVLPTASQPARSALKGSRGSLNTIENTVNMDRIMAATTEQRRFSETNSRHARVNVLEESRVTEGRKSFPWQVGEREEEDFKTGNATSQGAIDRGRLKKLPTPSRHGGGLSASSRSPVRSRNSPSGQGSLGGFRSSPLRKGGLFGPSAGGASKREHSADGSVGGSPGPKMLASSSTLQPISGGGSRFGDAGGSFRGSGSRLSWDEFLAHSQLSFMCSDLAPLPMPCLQQLAALARGAGEGPEAEQERQRAQLWEQALKGLHARSAAAQEKLKAGIKKWNQSIAIPPAAEELARAMDAPIELSNFQERAKRWQNECKQKAASDWHQVKQDRVSQELALERGSCHDLQRELAMMNEAIKAEEAASKARKRQKGHLLHQAELRRVDSMFKELSEQPMRLAKEDQLLMQKKMREAEAASEADQKQLGELRRKVEEARAQVEDERASLRQAKLRFLHLRQHRVNLQLGRAAKTCEIKKATATSLELHMRGGARADIQQATSGSSGVVRIVFLPPTPSKESSGARALQDLPALRAQLYERLWLDVLASATTRQEPHGKASEHAARQGLQMVVADREVARLVQRLDFGNLRVCSQLQALQKLPRDCPEVFRVAVQFRGADALTVAVTLVIVHSHDVLGGRQGIVPKASLSFGAGCEQDASLAVDASRVVVELDAKFASFPEAVDWSTARVRQIFGHGEAAIVKAALRGERTAASASGSLGEAVAAAALVMARAGAAAA